jgi:hypothetical protein
MTDSVIDFRKFLGEQFTIYMDDKYGDGDKVSSEKFWAEYDRWLEDNGEALFKQFEEYCQQFIYKGEK